MSDFNNPQAQGDLSLGSAQWVPSAPHGCPGCSQLLQPPVVTTSSSSPALCPPANRASCHFYQPHPEAPHMSSEWHQFVHSALPGRHLTTSI